MTEKEIIEKLNDRQNWEQIPKEETKALQTLLEQNKDNIKVYGYGLYLNSRRLFPRKLSFESGNIYEWDNSLYRYVAGTFYKYKEINQKYNFYTKQWEDRDE